MRRVVLALLLGALSLLSAGCRLDAVVELALERDGAGALLVELSADAEVTQRAAAADVDPLGELARRVDGLRGWDATVRDGDDGGRRVRLSADFADAGQLQRLVAGFAEALDAPELRPLERLAVAVDGERLQVRGVAGLRPTAPVAELGLTADEARAALEEAVAYQVRVRLPGEVLDSNADRAADGVLIWQVPAGRRVELYAEGSVPDGNLAVLLAGGAAAALLAGLWLRWRGAG